MTDQEPSRPSRPPRKWRRIATVTLLVMAAAAVWGGKVWIPGKVAAVVESRLAEREMALEWKSSSWNPWRGVHLTGVVLRHTTGEKTPLVESDNLYIHLPIDQWLNKSGRITYWSVRNSSVTLTDASGPVSLKDVSLSLKVEPGKVTIHDARAKSSGLDGKVTGTILTGRSSPPKTGPIKIDLKPVRGILAALDFQDAEHPFRITGTFSLDMKNPDKPWNAKLNGAGQDLDWKGFKIDKASAEAALTSADSTIHAGIVTSAGSVGGVVSRSDWKGSPFVFDGKIQDTAGKIDTFNGNYDDGSLIIEKLKGPANLHKIAMDILPDGAALPGSIDFAVFPEIEAGGIRWRKDGGPTWSIDHVEWASKSEASFKIKESTIAAKNLRGKASYDGSRWRLEGAGADLLRGTVGIDGIYQDGKLMDGRIKAEEIRISEIGGLGTDRKGAARKGVLSLDYRGSIDIPNKHLDGSGSMRLEEAPVIEVPLLDQVYELFTTLIPGVERSGSGRFDAKFTAKSRTVEVTRFEATGGSLTVSAVGTINLEKEYVSGRARGKLTGLPGMVTKPLGRLLEMDVAGPYGDIRVKPLGPAKLVSNAASSTVGVAVDTVEEAGRITGTILTEGVKLPFRLFGEKSQKQEEEGSAKPERRR